MERNVVLVTADSIRADHCGFLNSALDTTPHLSDLASDALVYENAIAPGPRTPSSMPVAFTGEQMTPPTDELDDSESKMSQIRSHMTGHRSIAQSFRDEGYTTVGVTTNPWAADTSGFDEGFDRFRVVLPDSREWSFPLDSHLGPVVKYAADWWNDEGWFSQWPALYDEVLEAVRGLDEPFFLWVFLLDSHNPYIVPRKDRVESSTVGMYHSILRSNSILGGSGVSSFKEELPPSIEQGVRQAYRDSIRSVDRFVGTLYEDLGAYDPVFVFHSDHGEAFGEHGTYGHRPVLYSENLQVPLVVLDADERGRVGELASLADLPAITMGAARDDESAVVESEYALAQTAQGDAVAVRDRRWKLVIDQRDDEVTHRLYDLERDRRERSNVADAHPSIVEELSGVADERIEGRSAVTEAADVDDGVEDHLRSLGYLSGE